MKKKCTCSMKKMRKPAAKKTTKKAEKKIKKVIREFDRGELHSGSKTGPVVTNKKQALAIGYSEARRKKKKK